MRTLTRIDNAGGAMNFSRPILVRCNPLFDSTDLLRRWRQLFLQLIILCGALLASAVHAEPGLEWGLCPDGQEQVVGTCFDKCKPGYYKVGLSCIKACPDNYVDGGFLCTNYDLQPKDIKGRQISVPGCPPNHEQKLLGCLPMCPPGQTSAVWDPLGIVPVCQGSCPPGTDVDFGFFCTRFPRFWLFGVNWGFWALKPTTVRNVSLAQNCKPGNAFVAGACLRDCPDNYRPVKGIGGLETPTCSKNCEHGWQDLEVMCQKDNSFIKEDLGSMFPRGFVNLCPDRDRDVEYPIVLVHGIFGFDVFWIIKWAAPIPITQYWQDVEHILKKGNHGAKHVYTAEVSGLSSNVVRAQQLLKQIAEIKKQTGKSRVHLFGHSLGAPTARMAANFDPSSIASVTSIAGANYQQGIGAVISRLAANTWWMPTDNTPTSADEDELEGNWVIRAMDLSAGVWSVLTHGNFNAYPTSTYLLAKELGNERAALISNNISPWGLPSFIKGQGESWDSPLAFIKPFDTKKFAALKLEYAQSLGKESFEELNSKQAYFFFDGKPDSAGNKTIDPYPRIDKQFPVLYYSWGGTELFWPTGIATIPYAILGGVILGSTKEHNDGMVDKRGVPLGKFLGFYNQDHLTSANIGLSSSPNVWFLLGAPHPLSLMCEQAIRLKKAETDILKVGAGGPGREPQWGPVTTNDHGKPLSTPVMLANQPTRSASALRSSAVTAPAAPQTMLQKLLANKAVAAAPMAAAAPSAALTPNAKPWQWQCLAGFNAPVRLSDTLDPQCLSSDGKNCSVQASPAACQSLVAKMNAPQPPAMTFAGCGAYAKGSALDLVNGAWCRNTREMLSDWKCLEGVNTPVRKSSSNEVQCLSTDGSQCATANNLESCAALVGNQLRSAKTLSCGEQHMKLYGQTGYDNPGHWCAKGRSNLPI